jgi:hypothetical protein
MEEFVALLEVSHVSLIPAATHSSHHAAAERGPLTSHPGRGGMRTVLAWSRNYCKFYSTPLRLSVTGA